MPNLWTIEDTNKALQMDAQGCPVRTIAVELNRTIAAVQSRLIWVRLSAERKALKNEASRLRKIRRANKVPKSSTYGERLEEYDGPDGGGEHTAWVSECKSGDEAFRQAMLAAMARGKEKPPGTEVSKSISSGVPRVIRPDVSSYRSNAALALDYAPGAV